MSRSMPLTAVKSPNFFTTPFSETLGFAMPPALDPPAIAGASSSAGSATSRLRLKNGSRL